MTPYPLIPPKVFPPRGRTKIKFLAFILSKIHLKKTTVSDVFNVYKSNHTSQPI